LGSVDKNEDSGEDTISEEEDLDDESREEQMQKELERRSQI